MIQIVTYFKMRKSWGEGSEVSGATYFGRGWLTREKTTFDDYGFIVTPRLEIKENNINDNLKMLFCKDNFY